MYDKANFVFCALFEADQFQQKPPSSSPQVNLLFFIMEW